jgi:hypothetical protein
MLDASKSIQTKTPIKSSKNCLPGENRIWGQIVHKGSHIAPIRTQLQPKNPSGRQAGLLPCDIPHLSPQCLPGTSRARLPANLTQILTGNDGRYVLGEGRGRKDLTLEDLPPEMDLRSERASAVPVAVAAGVFGADAYAAAVESRETASEARGSLAPPSSRSPATAGRCTHRPAPSAFLVFLHTPSIAQPRYRRRFARRASCLHFV